MRANGVERRRNTSIWRVARGRPIVVAHRGASASAPENTMAAFEMAVTHGADAIELDVRLTRDGEVVVFHDATLRRTTNGSGRVSDRTLAELKHLDAGSWFHTRFARERIPTLGEVLDAFGDRMDLNIEIKPVSSRQHARRLVEACVVIVRDHLLERSVLFSSFQHSLLRDIRRLAPDISIGVLYHPVRQRLVGVGRLIRDTGADFFICAYRSLRKKIVRAVREHEVALAVYGVNNEMQFRRAMSLNVEAIVTDKPADIVSLLQTRILP